MVKKKSLSISYKRGIVQEKQKSVGNPNGGTQFFLQIFLAPEQQFSFTNFQILPRSRGKIYNS